MYLKRRISMSAHLYDTESRPVGILYEFELQMKSVGLLCTNNNSAKVSPSVKAAKLFVYGGNLMTTPTRQWTPFNCKFKENSTFLHSTRKYQSSATSYLYLKTGQDLHIAEWMGYIAQGVKIQRAWLDKKPTRLMGRASYR